MRIFSGPFLPRGSKHGRCFLRSTEGFLRRWRKSRTLFPCTKASVFVVLVWAATGLCKAQDNYEIQVYGAETVAPATTMVELHSNFTVKGSHALPNSIYTSEGTVPTNHAEHETLEITHGINKWAEVGFYVFTSINPGEGWQWVGDHVRPRVRAPDSWHLPVGLSLSTEFGYQRARYSPDTWSFELRPIVDRQVGRWYLAANPALERSFHGPSVPQGVTFSPAVKAGYDFSKKVNAGLEYYGAYGNLISFDTVGKQEQQFFAATDLNVSPEWEINLGIGLGVTGSTDHLIVKGILGRHFNWRTRH